MRLLGLFLILLLSSAAAPCALVNFESRLPAHIEQQILEKHAEAKQLTKEGKNEEALKVFEDILNTIKQNYPTREKTLWRIGRQYTDTLFENFFRQFIKTEDYYIAEKVNGLLMEYLPYNHAFIRTSNKLGDIYSLSEPEKAINYYEIVINNCVPRFYDKLWRNRYCIDSARKLALLHEGEEQSIALWERIIEEDPGSHYAKEAKKFIYISQNYTDYDKEPLKLYLKTQRWQESANYEKIIEDYPEWGLTPYLYLLAFEAYEREGNRDMAIVTIESYLEKFPNYSIPPDIDDVRILTPTVMLKIGDFYQKIDPHISIKWYEKITSQFNDEIGHEGIYVPKGKIVPFTFLRIGWMYEGKLKDYTKAIHAYRSLIERFPNYEADLGGNFTLSPAVTAHFRIVRIYLNNLDNPEAAENELFNIYKSYPNTTLVDKTVSNRCQEVRRSKAEAQLQLAELNLKVGRYDKALEHYRILLNEYYDSTYGVYESEGCDSYGNTAINKIVDLLIMQQKISDAKEELRTIISGHESQWAQAYAQYNLGELYEKQLNDIPSAIREYRKVLERYPHTTNMMTETGPADSAEKRLNVLEKNKD